MSMPSGKPVPFPSEESTEETIAIDWSDLSARLVEHRFESLAQWLEADLAKLEAEQSEYVSRTSQFSGRS